MKQDGYLDQQSASEPPTKIFRERLWTVLIACLSAAFASFGVGYGLGYSSAAVTKLSDRNTKDLFLDETAIAWFGVRKFF